ncbi:MAG: hypothetical protein OHK0040_10240 [bacterium]
MEREKILILLVDDDEIGRYTTKKTLITAGYEVVEAETGKRAYDLALQYNPDLIILDVHLPDISGFEVLKLLKTDERTKILPVIHLSATYKDMESKITGITEGADAYLVSTH